MVNKYIKIPYELVHSAITDPDKEVGAEVLRTYCALACKEGGPVIFVNRYTNELIWTSLKAAGYEPES